MGQEQLRPEAGSTYLAPSWLGDTETLQLSMYTVGERKLTLEIPKE